MKIDDTTIARARELCERAPDRISLRVVGGGPTDSEAFYALARTLVRGNARADARDREDRERRAHHPSMERHGERTSVDRPRLDRRLPRRRPRAAFAWGGPRAAAVAFGRVSRPSPRETRLGVGGRRSRPRPVWRSA